MADLITRSYAKQFLKITTTDSDDLIDDLISAASEQVQNYLERILTASSYTIDISLDYNTKLLYLPQFPIITLTQVQIYPNESGNTETYDSTAFNVDYTNGILQFMWDANRSVFPKGFQNIEVQYSAGYSSVPANLQLATAMVVANMYANSKQDVSISSERLGDYSVSYGNKLQQTSGIDDGTKKILSKYKRQFVA